MLTGGPGDAIYLQLKALYEPMIVAKQREQMLEATKIDAQTKAPTPEEKVNGKHD
jgi:hypothetical protein